MFSLNFMFLCSLIEELCTKEENDETSCNFNFGHECSKNYPEIESFVIATHMNVPLCNFYLVT